MVHSLSSSSLPGICMCACHARACAARLCVIAVSLPAHATSLAACSRFQALLHHVILPSSVCMFVCGVHGPGAPLLYSDRRPLPLFICSSQVGEEGLLKPNCDEVEVCWLLGSFSGRAEGRCEEILEDPFVGPGRFAQGAETWTFKPVMKKGRSAGYVAIVLLTTLLLLLQKTCSVTAFLVDAAPQPYASGYGFPGFNTMRHRSILRDEVVARLKELGNVSDSRDVLERTFLSPAALAAGRLLATWMRDAGLRTWEDELGNVHGRADGANATAPALLLGSHLDTVIDAGRYDGALGIVTAIAAVKALKLERKLQQFPRPIEIIAFSDEEGIRFHTTFLGSSAIAGTFQPRHLKNLDARGISIGAALRAASHRGTIESLSSLKYEPLSVWGYVELHIEQGPVLESHGLPLGVVEAIAGQTRLTVKARGSQGHAGTVPMAMRKDPMIAAAQSIVAIESICTHPEKGVGGSRGATIMSTAVNYAGAIVCTVGEIHSWPGASNVIPGEVMFTIDVRSKDDADREKNVLRIESQIQRICRKRGVACSVERKHEADAVNCAPGLSDMLNSAAVSAMKELPPFRSNISALEDGGTMAPLLVSGAGHDAMAMSLLTQVGMLFLRCTGGVSHSPAEHVLDDDIWAGSLALLRFIEGVLGDVSFRSA